VFSDSSKQWAAASPHNLLAAALLGKDAAAPALEIIFLSPVANHHFLVASGEPSVEWPLEAQEGRLFKPLAYTKTFSMAAAALLSVTLVPALMIVFVRGRIIPEQKNPLNRFLIRLYRPIIKAVLGAKVGK
jgi:hypothetical protein